MKNKFLGLSSLLLAMGVAACTPTPPAPTSTPATVDSVSVTVSSNISTASTRQVVFADVNGTGAFNKNVTWSATAGGTFTKTTGNTNTFIAPTVSVITQVTITATSTVDSSKTDSVQVTVNPVDPASTVTGVAINTNLVNVRENGSTLLSGSVTGTGNFGNALTWTIESGGAGILSSSTGSSVLYTAPLATFGQVVRVTATSVQNPTQKKTIYLGLHSSKPSISAGKFHSMALKSNGGVSYWGRGYCYGFTDNAAPVDNSSLASDVVAVAAGFAFCLALKADGTVKSAGNDSVGELGNDATANYSSSPVDVLGATGIVAISAGDTHALALKSDGTVIAWGYNNVGQLGDGTSGNYRLTPVVVTGAKNIVAISAGYEHSLALKSDGTVLAWGSDDSGQLGDGGSFISSSTPVAVSSVASGIVAISAGRSHSLALKADGTLLQWGLRQAGSFANADPAPLPVPNTTGIIAISAGGFHSLALKTDGTVLAWGYNNYGQLGDSTTDNRPTPVVVKNSSGAAINGIAAITSGGYHSLALKSDGTMLSWGSDLYGQLGDGGAINSSDFQQNPMNVTLGSGITIRVP